MRNFFIGIFFSISFAGYAQKEFKNTGLKISVNDKGMVTTYYGDKEYLPENADSYLLRAKINGLDALPLSVKWKKDVAEISFPDVSEIS